MTGPPVNFLRGDRHHAIRSSFAKLEHGVATAITPPGVRSWHMAQVPVVQSDPQRVTS
jgi:hypothetical protein